MRVPVVASLVLVLGVTGAFAVVEDNRSVGRFDHRVRHHEGRAIGVEARQVEALAAADELGEGWREFGRRHGAWRVFLDERTGMPALASGRGIEWFTPATFADVTLDTLEARALAFATEQSGLLGDWGGIMTLDTAASLPIGKDHWQIVFRQVVDGVTVENARLDLHVKYGRLVMFGATNWGQPTIGGVPTLDADEARAALDVHLETSTQSFIQAGDPELVIVALDPDPGAGEPGIWTGPRGEGLTHVLIWRFKFREPGAAPLWVGEIDAHDGTVWAFFDGAHYEAIRGGVFPISNDNICPDGGCEVAGFPMPFADYTESGEPETFTDTYGNLSCSARSSSFETNLIGPYVRIDDTCGALSESGTCEDGLDLGLKSGENCDVEPGISPGNSAAARTAYYHINRAAETARFYDPTNTWLQGQVTVNVNIDSTCNATWNGEINMYGEGNGCGNTGQQRGVLIHEWGHGYDEFDGGGTDSPGEAYADIVAIFANRSSCMSRGWYNDGSTCSGYGDACLTCTGIRDFDWTARQNNTPATPTGFLATCPAGVQGWAPCAKEAHCESYVTSETMFDLVTRDLPASGMDQDSAWQLAERLWYMTRPGSGGSAYNCIRLNLAHSCFATHWMQRMLVVDDDDGDLSNGTPHAAEIFAAFNRHGIKCGNVADPENQSTSSCPTLAAPVLTVVETPAGTELSWGTVANASEYRVYRGDLGCNRQQVGIASVSAPTTSFVDTVSDPGLPRAYRVEAFGANSACSSPVSGCESTPLGAVLQLYDHRLVEPGPVMNGFPDPGETVQIPITLLNSGVDASFGTTGALRLVDPDQGRILEPATTWADIPSSDTAESASPAFELVVFEDTPCGEILELEFDAWASNATTRRYSMLFPMGDKNRDFVNDASMAIPPETAEPVTSTIVIGPDHTVAELDVTVNIGHPDTTELVVELTSPDGTTVRLHDQSDPPGYGINARYDLDLAPDGPGSMADFVGESTQGTWTLAISDVGPAGAGSLLGWTVHLTIEEGFDCDPQICPEPTPTIAVDDLVVDVATNGSDLDLSWGAVGGVAGYHVLQSGTAPFDVSVDLTGRTTGATAITVTDGLSLTPDLTYFQVRAVNSCNQEGP